MKQYGVLYETRSFRVGKVIIERASDLSLSEALEVLVGEGWTIVPGIVLGQYRDKIILERELKQIEE